MMHLWSAVMTRIPKPIAVAMMVAVAGLVLVTQAQPAHAQSSSAYFLQNKATGFYLDSNVFKQVYTHSWNGGSYQKWQLESSGTGYYFLRNVATGFVLDSNASKQVYTQPKNGGSYQQWRLVSTGTGYYYLQNKATGFYLDSNASKQVYTHSWNGGSYQQWRFQFTQP
jgi:hypothetical protein